MSAPQEPALSNEDVAVLLTEIKKIEDPFRKATRLAELSSQLLPSRSEVLEQALEATRNIGDDESYARALSVIASQLPESKRITILQHALEAAHNILDELYCATALSTVASQLSESQPQLLQQALEAAHDIQNEEYRARVLSAIAPQLSESQPQLLQQALKAAYNIQNEESRARVLSAIAPQLSESKRTTILQQALKAAYDIQNEEYRARVLSAIAPQLSESQPQLLQQALKAAYDIQNEEYRARALSAIVPHLSNIHPGFLEIALKLPSQDAAKALAPVALRLSEEIVLQFPNNKLPIALSITQQLNQDSDKVKYLSALVTRLSTGLLPNALNLIETSIQKDAYRAEALANLVPYLPTDQLSAALKLVKNAIKLPFFRTDALEHLIPYLSPGKAQFDVLRMVQPEVLPDSWHRARILAAVVSALTTEQLNPFTNHSEQEASTISLNSESTPSELQKLDETALIQWILTLTQTLKETQEQNKSEILCTLASKLSGSVLDEALAIIKAFKDKGYQAQVLQALAPHLFDTSGEPKAIIQDLIWLQSAAEKVQDNLQGNSLKVKVWSAIPEKLSKAQKLADQIKQEFTVKGVEALVEIASHPFPDQLRTSQTQLSALRAIRELKNSYLKAQYLQHLTPYLLDIQSSEAANVAQGIENPYYQAKALVTLACRFPQFRQEASEVATALKQPVQRIEQLSLLSIEVPEVLTTIIKDLEDLSVDQENAAKATIHRLDRKAILDALAPHLPARITREANREYHTGRPVSDDLWDRARKLLARNYRAALKGGSLRNDAAQDEDLLNLKDEINALSDLLLMRDLEPPMAVGILGGWGGGKSYIMHLMQSRMVEIRSRTVAEDEAWHLDINHEKLSPYVGHVYQIQFDAWTYSKADLWASFMQTVFFELDRQLTLEKQLIEVLSGEKNLPKRRELEGKVWSVLYKTSDADREWFLKRVLTPELFQKFEAKQSQREYSGILWRKFQESQAEVIERLKRTRQELEKAKEDLETG